MQRRKREQKGFTLLEILLVIAAIGLLAAIVLIAINPNRQINQARNAQRRSDINSIYKAIEQYLIDRGNYPAGIISLKRDICKTKNETVGGSTNCTGKVDLRELVPEYIAGIPEDPIADSYKVGINTETNRVSVEAGTISLGQAIVINAESTETTINNQIAVGSLVPTVTQTITGGRIVYTNQTRTQTYIDRPTTTRVCPTGYIAVPGNGMYGTSDFCVMKYEAKAVSTTDTTTGLITPTTGLNTIANNTTATTSSSNPPRAIASVASGYPIANINQTTAASYCSTAGASLITNREWMTIARNIEGQLSNWTTGTATSSAIGTGGLYRGHSDNSPSTALVAGADNNGYIGTGQSGFSIERRTHSLSNGEIIWDIGGNVNEWTNDTIVGIDKPNNNSGAVWQEWTVITNFGTLSYDLTRPSNNTWNSTQNIGRYIADDFTGPSAFLRGGSWSNASFGGVFLLDLSADPATTFDLAVGFRCVVR
jgi:type IV pilus assembly protein PilA